MNELLALFLTDGIRPSAKSIGPELAKGGMDTVAWTESDKFSRSTDTIQTMSTDGLQWRRGWRHNMSSKVEKRELGRVFFAPDGK